jgi:hypothetical protein
LLLACDAAAFSRSEGKAAVAEAGDAKTALARAKAMMAAVMALVAAVVMELSIGYVAGRLSRVAADESAPAHMAPASSAGDPPQECKQR